MSRILICGEGFNDIGRREWNKREGEFATLPGWLQPMVARLRSSDGDADAIALKELITFPGRGARPAGGLARKAQIAKFRAGTEGFSGVVVATDADSADPRVHAAKAGQIIEGFGSVDNGVTGVACVPMATSEAWLLADRNAWAALRAEAFGEWPSHPERCWGRPHDLASGHPKMLFARICRNNDIADNTDTRTRLAATSAIDELCRRAPVSFPPFAEEAARL